MVPAKLTYAATALALGLAALAFGAATRDTSEQQGAASLLSSPAEAREADAAPSDAAPAPVAEPASGDPAKASTRTVRVVLGSPFGAPPDVVLTTEPAKPPVFDHPAPARHATKAAADDAAAQEKPRRKKKAAKRPAADMFAGQGLPPPFFAVLPR